MDRLKQYLKSFVRWMLAYPALAACMPYASQLCTTSEWIFAALNRYKKLTRIIPRYPLHFYLLGITNEIRAQCSKCPEQRNLCTSNFKSVFAQGTDETKMFVSKLVFMTGLLDDSFCRDIMEFAQTTSNPNYRYWTTMDIGMYPFMLQSGFYPSYYLDRKQLLKKIAIEGKYHIPAKVGRRDNAKESVCILAYMLVPNLRNSMVRVAWMVANAMRDYFEEVTVLSLDSLYVSKEDGQGLTTSQSFGRFSAIKHKFTIDALFGKSVNVRYVSGKNYHERSQSALSAIYSINPCAIIDITDEYGMLSYYYSKDFKTLYMPLRSCASSSFYSLIEGVRWKFEEGNKKYGAVDMSKVFDWSFPEYVPEARGGYQRDDLGVSENAFIVLTIGKCSNCCSDAFVDAVYKLLMRNDQMVWLIVGDTAPLYLKEKYPDLIRNHRVIERPYEKNLRALCSACDVLLRTETTGGSGSTAIAAMSGLPVAMTNGLCDPMRWLGRDYSPFDNWDDVFSYVERLSNDPQLYEKAKQQVINLVLDATDAEEKWRQLAQRLIEE